MLHLPEISQMERDMNESDTGFVFGSSFDVLSGLNSTRSTLFPDFGFPNVSVDPDRNDAILKTVEVIGDLLSLYYIPIVAFSGSIGNILSVVVFFKTKLKKLSSSYYLAALAVSDTCFLFSSLMQWMNFIGIGIYNMNTGCQLLSFLSYLSSFLSVWFVVAFTVERFIAVMYPLKRQSMCTVRRAKIVLAGLTVAGCIHSAPIIYFATPVYNAPLNQTICDVSKTYKNHLTIFNYLDTAVVFAVPFTAIAVLNTITGCTVWKFATVRRTMTTHKRKTQIARTFSLNGSTRNNVVKQQQATTLTPSCPHPNGRNSISQNGATKSCRGKITNSSQIKVTKMLLIVSTVFVCLNLPSYVMRVRAFLESGHVTKTTVVIQYICWFFFMTNFGINFVLYCVSGQNFRRAVISLFRKASSSTNVREGTTQVTAGHVKRNDRLLLPWLQEKPSFLSIYGIAQQRHPVDGLIPKMDPGMTYMN